MKASRPRILISLTLGVGLAVWLLLRLVYSSLPPLPWTAVPTLLLLALGEGYTGWTVRVRIHRKPDRKSDAKIKPIDPLAVARLAALGKASASAAAAIAGVFGGFAVYLSSSLDKPSYNHDFYVSIGTFVAAIALVAGALFLEWCCRVPKDPDADHA